MEKPQVQAADLINVAGVRVAAVASHVRYANRLDLVLMELSPGSNCVGVFTQNAFCAAPVHVARAHLERSQGAVRYLLINTGNANAGTGQVGIQDAIACCEALAKEAGVQSHEVLPFSTGVIGEKLPVHKITAGIPVALNSLGNDWLNAAKGIMTTDTCPKARSVTVEIAGQPVVITGISKGAGMIKPNMATMLSFVFTDAKIEHTTLQSLLQRAVDQSFNRITVDGDTSTNDCCVLSATGRSGVEISAQNQNDLNTFEAALQGLVQELAKDIIRDAEGAKKFVTVDIKGGLTSKECLLVAYAISESPLVKTALSASDPNWGRILAAVGRAGLVDLDVNMIDLYLGDVCIVSGGRLAPAYTEAQGQAQMNQEQIFITVDLKRGDARETVWTSDLSEEYVRINASYRS